MKRFSMFLVAIMVLVLSACNGNNNNVFDIVGTEEKVIYVGTDLPDFLDGVDTVGIAPDGEELLKVDTSAVNVNQVGSYDVKYFIELNGEEVYQETIQVIVTDGPVDEHPLIKGVKDLEYIIGEEEPDFIEGVTVSDNKYGNITAALVVDTSNVDLNEVGTYDVNYVVENNDGYFAYESATITVKYGSDLSQLPEEFLIVRENGKKGIVNVNGEVIIDVVYDSIMYMGNEVVGLAANEKVFYFNLETTTYFDMEYRLEGHFVDGLAPVTLNLDDEYSSGPKYMPMPEKFGYINTNGELVIPAIYDRAYIFEDGVAKVRLGYNYGFINTNGEEVVEVKYDSVSYVDGYFHATLVQLHEIFDKEMNLVFTSDGLDTSIMNFGDHEYYRFYKDSMEGLVNSDFEVVVPALYDSLVYDDGVIRGYNSITNLYDFYTPTGVPLTKDITSYFIAGDHIVTNKEGKFGVYTKDTYEMIISPVYSEIDTYIDGYYIIVDEQDKKGVVSEFNEVVIPTEYVAVYQPNENSVVKVRTISGYKLYDLSGNELTENEYYYIGSFVDGYAIVQTHNFDEGVINQAGVEKIPAIYQQVIRKNSGYFYTKTDGNSYASTWGVVSPNFEQVLDNSYYYIGDLADGLFPVRTSAVYDSSGYMNTAGEIVVPLDYKSTSPFVGGIGRVRLYDNTYKLMNPDGEFINDEVYTTVYEPTPEGYIGVRDVSGKYGVVDNQGTVVGSMNLDGYYAYSDGFFTVKYQNHTDYLDLDGNLLIGNRDLGFEHTGVYHFSGEYVKLKDTNGKYYVMDTNGTIILEGHKNYTFGDSTYIIVQEQYDKYGLYDGDTQVVESKYNSLRYPIGGYSMACEKDLYTCGIIDVQGEEIIPLTNQLYDLTTNVYWFDTNGRMVKVTLTSDSLTYEVSGSEHDFTGVLDSTTWEIFVDDGETPVVTGEFDTLRYYSFDRLLVKEDGIYKLIDSEGNTLFSSPYEDFLYHEDNTFVLVNDYGNSGLYTKDGTEIVPPIYDSVMYVEGMKVIIVRNGDRYGCYDLEGNMVLDIIYEDIMYITKDLDIHMFMY